MDFTTDAIVIRETLHGEGDKMLTLLSADYGKIFVYAKGVKKMSSKNAPACQVFAFSEFDIIEKSGRKLVKSAHLKEVFYGMRSDISRFALGCYFADVICHVATENSNEGDMLRLLLNALYALSNKADIPAWVIKGAFELKLMCLLGYCPEFSTCFMCCKEIEYKRNNIFSLNDGCIICEECAGKFKADLPSFSVNASDTTLNTLAYISHSPIEKFLSFKYDYLDSSEFLFVCENYLINKTERSFETLKIYKSIVNSLKTNNLEKNETKK